MVILFVLAIIIGVYVAGKIMFSRRSELTQIKAAQNHFDPNIHIPQEKRVFRPDEESKIVEEWKQFQNDRMKPYFEAHYRGEITAEQVDQAMAECPSFRVWLRKYHPDAFNWMKYIPD